jgi:hypothetical protein
LKRSLIIPVPQFLSLAAKTWREAYISHKESEQWKKFEIRATFKIAIFLRMVKNIEKEFDHPCATVIGFDSLDLTGSLFLSQGIWAMNKFWDSSNFQNRYIFGNGEKYWKGVWSSLRHSYWVWELKLDGKHILVIRNLCNEKNLKFEQLWIWPFFEFRQFFK